MAKPAELEKLTGLASRFGAFVAERHPFALGDALDAFEAVTGGARAARRGRHRRAAAGVSARARRGGCRRGRCRTGLPDTTPRTSAAHAAGAGARRAARRVRRLPAPRGDRRVADARRAPRDPARHGADARHRQPAEGVLHRRRGALRRRRRSRARASGRSGRRRSTRAGIRLRRGAAYRDADGALAGRRRSRPIIRDLGVALAMRPEPSTVRMVLNAQMGKAGPPMDGKDLHIGDFELGHPAAGRAAVDRTLTIAGMAMAFARDGSGRVARVVHRRRRIVARRMARGDQSLRRAPAAGDLLRRRTTRPRCRRRSPSSRRCACSPTRRPATASRASRSTAPIPTRSPPRSPGRPSARAPGRARR